MTKRRDFILNVSADVLFKLRKRLVPAWAVVLGGALLCGSAVASTPCPTVGFTVVESRSSSENRAVRVDGKRTIFVRRAPITTTSDIVNIKLIDEGDDDASLMIKFTPEAAQRLHDATTNRAGLRIAFIADDEVLLNVIWEGPYGMETDGTKVSMRHGLKDAQKLMEAIARCIGAPA